MFGCVLIVQAIEVTAVSLMCSAWFSSTGGAMVGTYFMIGVTKSAVCALSFYGAIGIPEPSFPVLMFDGLALNPPLEPLATNLNAWSLNLFIQFPLFMLLVTGVSLLFSAFFLVLTRYFLVRQVRVTTQETSLKAFVDRVGELANRFNQNSLTRGAVLIREGRREPENDPVAWRETTTRALGQPRYLIGNFLALELPIISFLVIIVARAEGDELFHAIATMQTNLWIGMLSMIAMVVSGMIIQERQKQTWDTLLVTPLTSREIVQQKMDGIQRMLWILQAPLWTCMLFRAWHEASVAYVLNDVSMLLVYPYIVAWIAMTCGIIYKKRIQAMLMTITFVFLWIGIGWGMALLVTINPLAVWLLDTYSTPLVNLCQLLAEQLCPATLPSLNLAVPVAPITGISVGRVDADAVLRQSFLPSIWNLLIYYGMLRLIRWRCLNIAEQTLRGRSSK
jgi:hypothetical protein